MTDPVADRLTAIGNEMRAIRTRQDNTTERVSDLREHVARMSAVVDSDCAAMRDQKRAMAYLEARVGVLEEAKAKAAGIRAALTILGGAGAGAGYNWLSEHGGALEVLAGLWAV